MRQGDRRELMIRSRARSVASESVRGLRRIGSHGREISRCPIEVHGTRFYLIVFRDQTSREIAEISKVVFPHFIFSSSFDVVRRTKTNVWSVGTPIGGRQCVAEVEPTFDRIRQMPDVGVVVEIKDSTLC